MEDNTDEIDAPQLHQLFLFISSFFKFFWNIFKMCPACYLNGFLFLIFGASGAAIASNPWVIALAIILTLAGFYWMWKAWKRRSTGNAMKNIKTTIIFLLVFGAGFITASFVTHEYFKNLYGQQTTLDDFE